MQAAKIPRSVCDSIDRKSRRFLWGGDENKRKVHLISWETIQKPKKEGGLGVRSARQSNAAFLTKLGYRVLAEPTSLWSRVLRHKYCQGRCDIDMFRPQQNMSNLWSGITSNAQTIRDGSTVAIGNGRHTLFWDHPWIESGRLSDKVIQPVPSDLIDRTVSDMWSETHGWKWNVFSDYLPREELLKIASISLSKDENLGDLLYWNGSASGKFTIKSALGYLRGVIPDLGSTKWEVIWRLPVQQRVRMFLWLAAHDRIMTNVNRLKRGLTDNPRCSRCGHEEEDTTHVLRDCSTAKHVWMRLGDVAALDNFYSKTLYDWIIYNSTNSNPIASSDWSMKFSITAWWIWKWRNNVIFGRENENPADPLPFLIRQFTETKKALDRFSILVHDPGAMSREIFVRWSPPPNGWILLSTDGASKGNPGLAGGGGILRDETGNFILAFFMSYGICSSMRAELLAVATGLGMAWRKGVNKLIVHMDNQTCVNLINGAEIPSNALRTLVLECRSLINQERWQVKLEHVYREANRAADWLANQGATEEQLSVTLEAPPAGLRTILREDALGVSWPRLVN